MKKLTLVLGLFLILSILNGCKPIEEIIDETKVGTLTGIVKDGVDGVLIRNAKISVGELSATTNWSGAFSLKNVPIGTCTVTIEAGGYESRDISIEVSEGANSSLTIELTPLPIQTLRGTVMNHRGEVLSGMEVLFRRNNSWSHTISDDNGEFSIDLRGGHYTISIDYRDEVTMYQNSSWSLEFPKLNDIRLFLWYFTPDYMFYKRGITNSVDSKEVFITWPEVTIPGRDVSYELRVYKVASTETRGLSVTERTIKTDNNYILLDNLISNGEYQIEYKAINKSTGSSFMSYFQNSFWVDTGYPEDPKTNEEWTDYLGYMVHQLMNVFNRQRDLIWDFEAYFSETYSDNFGRDKEALLKQLTEDKSKIVNIYKVEINPLLHDDGSLVSAEVSFHVSKIDENNNYPSSQVELTILAEQGVPKISKALIEEKVSTQSHSSTEILSLVQ